MPVGRTCPSGSLTDFTIKQLTDFGGRPRWSNDGKRIAFVEGEYAQLVQTYSYNLTTRELINQTKSAAHEEPEGLFPDDRFAAMESDHHIYNREEPQYEQFINSDIYMLGIDGTGKKSYRLSHVARDSECWANNPNVSPDGCGVTYSIGVGPSTSSNTTGTFGGVQTIEFFQCKE